MPTPFLSGFGKRKALKYGTTFPASDQTDFPKLFKILADSDVASELAGGGGIAVTAGDGTTTVPFGLYPSSDPTSGDLILRAKFDVFTGASTGDVIGYLYYDAGQTTTEDRSGVVSNNYALFMTLDEDPSGSAPQFRDWVTDTLVGTSAGFMTLGDSITGVVGKAVDPDGADDYIEVNPSGLPDIDGEKTIEVWTQHDGSTNTHNIFSMFLNDSSGAGNCCVMVTEGDEFSLGLVVVAVLQWGGGRRAEAFLDPTNANVATDTWFYTAYTTGSGWSGQKMYINGIDRTFNPQTSADAGATGASRIGSGNAAFPSPYANRPIDELRVSSVARSTNWLAYVYQDDGNNADTFSLGDEELDATTPTKESLIGYWALDESSGTRLDSHGSNDLTDNNTVGSATGKVSNAASFTVASSEYLNHASNSDLQVGDFDWTVGAWVNLNSGGTLRTLVGKYPGTGNREYLLWWYHVDGYFKWTVIDGTGTSVEVSSSNFGVASAGVWYLVIADHDATNGRISISVNAGAPNTTSIASGPVPGTGDFNVGKGEGGVGYADGLIDEVFFYKRLLTQSEKGGFYNGGTGITYSDLLPAPTTNYVMTVGSGTFGLTGSDVGLKIGRKVAAGAGTFSMTGATVGLKVGHKIPVASGAYSLTGTAVALKADHKMAASAGTYTLTGAVVGLRRGYPLVVGGGAYTLTGGSVGLKHGYKIPVGLGSYTLTGTDVTLTKGGAGNIIMSVGSGTYSLTGSAVSLKQTHTVSVIGGLFALTGTAVSLKHGYKVSVAGGMYTLTGTVVGLKAAKSVSVGSGSYTWTGAAVSLIAKKVIAAGAGVYSLAGAAVGLRQAKKMTVASGTYSLVGSTVNLFVGTLSHGLLLLRRRFWT